jgi:hypothetical protein
MLVRVFGDRTNTTKWMTLPIQSGNMSQLYRGFSWSSMVAILTRCDGCRVDVGQFEPFVSHFASP